MVEDRQVARAAGGVGVRPRRRERRHRDFRGLQNFVNRASGASGIRRIRRVLRLAAQHREADARARARLASQGTACTRSSARGRGWARVSGFERRTPRARRRASTRRRRACAEENEKEIRGRGRTRAGVGAPLLHRAERPDVRQGPVQEYRLRGRGGADRSASRTARRRGDGGRLHATERGGAVEAPRMPRLLVGRVGTHVTLDSGPQGIVDADLRDTSEGPGSAGFGMVPRARPEAGWSRPQPLSTTTCSKIRLHPRLPGRPGRSETHRLHVSREGGLGHSLISLCGSSHGARRGPIAIELRSRADSTRLWMRPWVRIP